MRIFQQKYPLQWRIQDFPDGRGARGGENLLFRRKLHENKRNWTERGHVPRALLESANALADTSVQTFVRPLVFPFWTLIEESLSFKSQNILGSLVLHLIGSRRTSGVTINI